MFLIDDLLMLPVRVAVWAIEQIHDRAMREMNDEPTVRRQLVEMRLRFEMGEIDERSYHETEALLLERLRQIRLARLTDDGQGD